jgi:hypothetical protein
LEKTIEEKQKKAEKVEKNIRNARVGPDFFLRDGLKINRPCVG